MAWYVKRLRPNGQLVEIRCEERWQVVRSFYEQEYKGGEVWIEDDRGKRSVREGFKNMKQF